MIICISSMLEQIIPELTVALLIIFIGWAWGIWRALRIWKTKQFKDRAVLALNTLMKEGDKYKLSLRTIFERDLYHVLQNESMVEIVKKAIDKVTPENPLLPLPKEDSWYVLNAVLNQIAEHFSEGTIRRDMGKEVTAKWYTFCLTFEKEGGLRMQKLRIMLIQKESLMNFPEDDDILLESEKHTTRIKTLRLLKEEIKKNPHLFMNIEIYT